MEYVKKFALILDEADGKIVQLAEKLKSLNFKIIQTKEPKVSLDIINRSNQISIFLINPNLCVDGFSDIIDRINDLNASITTVWFENKKDGTKFPGKNPKVLIQPNKTAAQLKQTIDQRLLRHIYPEKMLMNFSTHCESILRNSFKVFSTPREPFLRSANKLLSDTAAAIYIVGDKIRGQIIISTTIGYLKKIFVRRTNSESISRSQIWDLTGEICNLLSGAFKAYFPASEHCLIGLPTVIYGKDIEIIPKYNQPSLVLAFDEGSDTIFVEFIFDSFSAEGSEQVQSVDSLVEEEGEVCFL